MLVIPLCLVFIGSISVRIEDKQIRVGILGSKEYIDYVAEELQNQEGISYQIADIETIHADTIMGKYHYVLKEQDSDNVLQNIKMTVKQKRDERMTVHAVRQCMLSVLLPVYMTIATLYGMKYLQDKRELALERVLVSGGTRRGYLKGEPVNLYTKEQLSNMTEAEIYEALGESVYVVRDRYLGYLTDEATAKSHQI